MSIDTDRRPVYPQFPGRRPGRQLHVLPEPASIRRLNGMPGFIPYIYRGTGRDTLTPNLGLRMSGQCLEDRCWQCTDPDYCPCACEHGEDL